MEFVYDGKTLPFTAYVFGKSANSCQEDHCAGGFPLINVLNFSFILAWSILSFSMFTLLNHPYIMVSFISSEFSSIE